MMSSGATVSSINIQTGVSYSNERTPGGAIDIEYATDPASGGFFHADYKKNDNLKQMLDSNKDNLKLEAMKRIIGMVAKGRDASDLFPAVVKNVVSKNIEVKKLVYVYLVRYAEEQQDMALLSISTFQRALKDPNQLIRAGALRVLSSIRVSMIVPIVMLAIRESAQDMSPYVRKTAAHAIPKLYSLDSEQKDELVGVIEKLLSDRTTLVVGSAVMAFEEVCPERVDLIHKNYKKLCNLLVDVDEWGQVIIINMLTRYSRTQFTDPNIYDIEPENPDKPFYDETSSGEESENRKTTKSSKSEAVQPKSLDVDHRILLRQTKPLLQSRNAAVVMAVAQLYHHIAPRLEVVIVAKALIRLLRGHKEVQSVVLTCIASMSVGRKGIFEQYMKSFFVRTSDPTHIKLLKLEILTNLASETNISIILREFQTYISSSDKDFVAATIQAIGRCAASIDEVTETCLSGLVHLLSNRDEHVVAESVVVIKKLLQTQVTEHFEIISQMAKLLDFITNPAARAAILWLIGEYNDRVPKIAPDVLRKLAQTFTDEEDVVKLQVLNLSVKLFLTNPEQTDLLCQYIFNLSRFDSNYDIRDRARFLKQIIFPSNGNSVLFKNAKNIFLAKKPAPSLESKHKNREQFQLGSLSHYLNMPATGYHDLPDFPEVAPDPSVRNVAESASNIDSNKNQDLLDSGVSSSSVTVKKSKKIESENKSFYSESEKSSEYDSVSGSDSSEAESIDDESKSDNDKENGSAANGEEESSESEDSSEDSSSSEEESQDEETSSSESESTESQPTPIVIKNKSINNNSAVKPEPKSNLDLLLDLDDIPPMPSNIMTPSLGGFLSPLQNINPLTSFDKSIELVGPVYIPRSTIELLNKVNGFGLGITYRFTRAPHLASSNMISIELVFTNHSNKELKNISIVSKNLPSGMSLHDFSPISLLTPKATMFGTIGIDFNDSTQPANFSITTSEGTCNVSIRPPIGELIRSISTQDVEFFKISRAKLRGMNEHSAKINLQPTLASDVRALQQRIYEIANFASFISDDVNVLNFIGQTMTGKSLVLLSIEVQNQSDATVIVNCEKMVVGSMILNEIKALIQK